MASIPIRTPVDFGALIRDRRRVLGLGQADLAAQIDVSRVWVNQVERGKPGAHLGLILRALGALGVELSVNISGNSEGERPSAAAPIMTPDIDAIVANARRKRRQR